MNDRVFDIYRQASESWFKVQQELFDGFYKSTMLLFQQTAQASQALQVKPSENHPRISDENGSKPTKTTPKPGSGSSRHSRKAPGRHPGGRTR
jgi:hypothetical protein